MVFYQSYLLAITINNEAVFEVSGELDRVALTLTNRIQKFLPEAAVGGLIDIVYVASTNYEQNTDI